MMRLKLFLKNSAKPALLFNLLISIYLCGCSSRIEPTYKEKDIPDIVKKICKDEYSLEVTTHRTSTTLWIYAPVNKMLDKDYGKKEDKIFDEEMLDKSRNILTTVGRVLISSDYTPDFFALVASDIKVGIDYTLIGNVLDMKKLFAGALPWPEANRRYVMKLNKAPEAVGDLSGKHLTYYDIKLPDFLAEQMAQRIATHFQDEERKKYFKVDNYAGTFTNNTFIIEYAITRFSKPDKEIDVQNEILDIIASCIKSYEFKDFSTLELVDLGTQDRVILSRTAIWARPTE